MDDYYKILEVHPEASPEVIAKAYKTLAYHTHPDRYHLSDKTVLVEKMKRLNDAYETLSDPVRRKGYDARYRAWHDEQAQTQRQRHVRDGLQNIGYWFLVSVLVLWMGRSALSLFFMLPGFLKALVLIGLVWLVRQIVSGRGGRPTP